MVIALALAFVSVLVVIYAFLGSLRATLIPAVTIPVSIIATFTAMYALGYTINVLDAARAGARDRSRRR